MTFHDLSFHSRYPRAQGLITSSLFLQFSMFQIHKNDSLSISSVIKHCTKYLKWVILFKFHSAFRELP